ncbi:MAG TPA: UvrD-helicase domain-containing protein [Polyangia bacterium]|nr:UvrD-helicase domain-containing protein [Polyangia bacterium]
MRFYADLHVHSKYSRATSSDCDLEHLALWARRKGITVLGTGDFTHPAWRAELGDKLVPAEPGLFRLREDVERAVEARLEPPCRGPVRFLLSVEISTIYKKGERTRKIHHLIYAPDFDTVDRLVRRLGRIGNLNADGRPILGLDSRHLLELVLEAGPGAYLIPAHIWTPWFSVLGSKAGFDAVDECYGDLAPHVFALETGLSSDPPMNWRLSSLDRYRLISCSDAHSPPKLGREASVFEGELDYFSMRRALETGAGYGGTIEFFPEEGKYHLDGHRKCGVRLEPSETRERGELCPVCGHPVTVGVLHRVEALADRPEGITPSSAAAFHNLVPLPEVLAEIAGTSTSSRAVGRSYEGLLGRLGPELFILEEAPLDELRQSSGALVAEAVERMRAGRVVRDAGYDGEYGSIHLFQPDELRRRTAVGWLFPGGDMAGPAGPGGEVAPAGPAEGEEGSLVVATGVGAVAPGSIEGDEGPEHGKRIPTGSALRGSHVPAPRVSAPTSAAAVSARDHMTVHPSPPSGEGLLGQLDPEQRAAASIIEGPLLIVAGPGTGKTRTLTYRIAHLVRDHGIPPEACLTITFTRRAAGELRERLVHLLGREGQNVPALTFHALGLQILRECAVELETRLGVARDFVVAGEAERRQLVIDTMGMSERRAGRLLEEISRCKRIAAPPIEGEMEQAWHEYHATLRERGWVDFDDLVLLAVALLEEDPALVASYRERYRRLSIDEYQDIDERQYRLVRLLAPPGQQVCAIGDPDQSIYRFRGADVGFFLRFGEDFAGARTVRLWRNYRSRSFIVEAARQVIAAGDGQERSLQAMTRAAEPMRLVLHEAGSHRAEAEFVVHTLEQFLGGHTFFSLDSGRAPGWSDRNMAYGFGDFAVLYRTERQAEALCEALARSGLPFQRRSHRRLAESRAVEALVRAIRPLPGSQPLGERLKIAGATLREAVAQPPAPPDPPPGDAAPRPSPRSRREDPDGPDERTSEVEDLEGLSESKIDEAMTLLTPLVERAGGDLGRFLLEVTLEVEMDVWDPRAERISLLTLHAAKGLEFPVVFIVGCEEGLVPLRFGGDAHLPPEDLAEERRLFYVGLTRARDRLLLVHARERLRHGRRIEQPLSPFVQDIDEGLIERSIALSRPARREDPQLKLLL